MFISWPAGWRQTNTETQILLLKHNPRSGHHATPSWTLTRIQRKLHLRMPSRNTGCVTAGILNPMSEHVLSYSGRLIHLWTHRRGSHLVWTPPTAERTAHVTHAIVTPFDKHWPRTDLKKYILRTFFQETCISEVGKIGSIIIFHMSKLWKAKFSILCDVIFLVRLQGKFEVDHSWEWK